MGAMNEFLKMDVFFLITTVAVLLVTGLVCFVLYRILRILRNVEHVSQIVSDESDLVRNDLSEMRAVIKREGFKLTHLAAFVRKRAASFMKPKKNE